MLNRCCRISNAENTWIPYFASKDLSSVAAELMTLSKIFKTESFHWDLVQSLGLISRLGKTNPGVTTAGKLLAHCKDQITVFREKIGVRICIFKIGVTTNPLLRFSTYMEQGYTSMWVLAVSQSVDQIHMLEAACISEFSKHVGCKNAANSGGEGALNRKDVVPPFSLVFYWGGWLTRVAGLADPASWR